MTEFRPVPGLPPGQVHYGCSCCCFIPLLVFLAVLAAAGLLIAFLA